MIDSGSPRNAPAKAVYGLLALDGTPPPEILRRGREQVRQYGGRVVLGEVVAAEPAAPSVDGDLRFTVTLADGRRVLVATGLKDELPQVPGLAEHWGHSVVHCHGWEMRDEPIGILASGMVGTTGAGCVGGRQRYRSGCPGRGFRSGRRAGRRRHQQRAGHCGHGRGPPEDRRGKSQSGPISLSR